ncbi:hypothetical protein NA51_18515 [Vibrio cholerae]|nr:hypothetical protein NA51_18515 [Vibrio cholerae]
MFTNGFLTPLLEKHFTQMHLTSTRPTPKAVKQATKTKTIKVRLATVNSPRQRKPDHSDDAAFCETKLTALNTQQR